MRVAFFIEPLLMHNRPFHYWAWLDYSANVYRALTATDRGYEFRFILNEALRTRAVAPYESRPKLPPRRGQGLPPDVLVTLPQEPIREIFNAPNLSILERLHRKSWSSEQLTRYGDLIREKLGSFVPDIIITRTPAPFLTTAYPDAVVLGTEMGPFSRAPYPATTFYDPRGLWADSIPGACAKELRDRSATTEEKELLRKLREHFLPYFQDSTPFAELEQALRKRYRKLALLPLQFGGESGFDLNAPFRNQGEYLFHVLERLPADIGLIVVEHPTAIWVGDLIDEETREYLKSAYPQVVFVDFRMAESAGQYLVHHVDYVICISSSLALQAIFWSKPLVSVGWSHFKQFATFDRVEKIDPALAPETAPSLDGALAWLLRYYYPQDSYAFHSGEWLDRFFRLCRERVAQGRLGLDFYDPIAPIEIQGEKLLVSFPGAPGRASRPSRELLRDGNFVRWSRGIGPFTGNGPTSDNWVLVADARSLTRVERRAFSEEAGEPPDAEGACVHIARKKSDAGPTFFLQRIPDITQSAGALMSLEFWARSLGGATITTYCYQQVDNPDVPCQGTPAKAFTLDGEWRRFTYSATLPRVDEGILGPRNHTEIVFCIPPESGAVAFDLAMVTFAPSRLSSLV